MHHYAGLFSLVALAVLVGASLLISRFAVPVPDHLVFRNFLPQCREACPSGCAFAALLQP